jgi:hypothetical protein
MLSYVITGIVFICLGWFAIVSTIEVLKKDKEDDWR